METTEKLNYISGILLLITGILHILQIVIFGPNLETVGELVFGIIYTTLGVLVLAMKDNKTIALLSVLLPILGMMVAILGLIIVYISLIVIGLIIIDAVIIPMRMYIYMNFE